MVQSQGFRVDRREFKKWLCYFLAWASYLASSSLFSHRQYRSNLYGVVKVK